MIKLEEIFSDQNLSRFLKLGLKVEDFREQFVRGSGKGGQKINKTSSTVLLRHEPSGLEVRLQKHRELSRNRVSAWKLLLEKLEVKELGGKSLKMQKVEKLKKQKKRRQKKAVLKHKEIIIQS